MIFYFIKTILRRNKNMAFRLGDKLYKEILYGYAEDLTTTNPLYEIGRAHV